jgi:hypothetical protein
VDEHPAPTSGFEGAVGAGDKGRRLLGSKTARQTPALAPGSEILDGECDLRGALLRVETDFRSYLHQGVEDCDGGGEGPGGGLRGHA